MLKISILKPNMKNKALKTKSIIIVCALFIAAEAVLHLSHADYRQAAEAALHANTDHLSYADYRQSVTIEMTNKDIDNFYYDLSNWIFPAFEQFDEQIFLLFGSKKNSEKFFDYIIYGTCMLTARHSNMEVVVKALAKCDTLYGRPIVDITDIIQKVRENRDKKAGTKDLANAILRTYDFLLKHRKLFPAIDAELKIEAPLLHFNFEDGL